MCDSISTSKKGYPVTITNESLQQRLKDTEARFNEAKAMDYNLSAQRDAANEECLRIQGDYRTIQQMIMETMQAEATKAEAEPSVAVANEGKEATSGRSK